MGADLRHTLLSAGEIALQKIVGQNTVGLLALIDERSIDATKLVDLITIRYGDEVLLNKDIVELLLLSLNKNQAIELLELVKHSSSATDPWRELNGINFRNSSNLNKLHEFFNIEILDPEEAEVPTASEESIHPQYGLFSYQRDVVTRAANTLGHGESRLLIHMPTGAGKTRSAMVLIAKVFSDSPPGTVIVWLAHSEELCDQAASEFHKCWQCLGDRPLSIGRYYSGYELDLSEFKDGFLVASLSKLHIRSFTKQSEFLKLKKNVKLILMDEAHQAIAPTYKHLLEMLSPVGAATKIIGLSATPGRSWLEVGQDEKLANFFDHNKTRLEVEGYDDPIRFLQEQGYLATPEYFKINYTPGIKLSNVELTRLSEGFDISERVLEHLGESEHRNLLILREVIHEVKAGSKIIVFACSVTQAHLLADVLVMRGVRARAVSTRTSLLTRRASINDFRSSDPDSVQVLINYGILTTGFDAPSTNVAIIARPTQSVVLYSQMIGRAMRGPAAGGNSNCRIYSVVDEMPGFRSIYEGFSHWEEVWN
jgi:superfamily II DNA or RNA helicase